MALGLALEDDNETSKLCEATPINRNPNGLLKQANVISYGRINCNEQKFNKHKMKLRFIFVSSFSKFLIAFIVRNLFVYHQMQMLKPLEKFCVKDYMVTGLM